MSSRDFLKMEELLKRSVEDIFNYMVICEMDSRIDKLKNKKDCEII